MLNWPSYNTLQLGHITPTNYTQVSLLGYGYLKYNTADYFQIEVPDIPFSKMPCDWGWVFKIYGLPRVREDEMPSVEFLYEHLEAIKLGRP